MPELPEVNRVSNILKRVALNTIIEGVQTTEDTIVYSDGITNLDFVSAATHQFPNEVP
jgi:formamidopyrimidine-DNA glycosylase